MLKVLSLKVDKIRRRLFSLVQEALGRLGGISGRLVQGLLGKVWGKLGEVMRRLGVTG